MNKTIIIIFGITGLFGCSHREDLGNLQVVQSEIKPAETYRWVEITSKADKGKMYYYGQIRDSDFWDIANTREMPKVLYIKNYYWFKDIKGKTYPMLMKDKERTGEVLLDVRDIIQIVEYNPIDMAELEKEQEIGLQILNQKEGVPDSSIP